MMMTMTTADVATDSAAHSLCCQVLSKTASDATRRDAAAADKDDRLFEERKKIINTS